MNHFSKHLGVLAAGVAGIHFYTLNRSRSTAEILRRLQTPTA